MRLPSAALFCFALAGCATILLWRLEVPHHLLTALSDSAIAALAATAGLLLLT